MGANVLGYIAQGTRPIDIDPYKRIAEAQAMQSGQQEQQLRGLQIQQAQRQQAGEAAMQKAWQDAGGDLDKMMEMAPKYGATPEQMVALQQHVLATKKTVAELNEKDLDAHIKHTDIAAGHVNSLLQLPEDQAAAQWGPLVQKLAHDGDIKPGDLPLQYPGHDAAQQFILGANGYKSALAAEQKNREITAQEKTAQARADAAATEAAKFQATLPGIQADTAQKQKAQDAQDLAAAAGQGPEALQAALDAMPHGRAKDFTGKTKPEDILKAALTPEQATTQATQAATHAEAARHNTVEEAQGAGRLTAENKRLGIEGARLGLEREKAGFDMSGGVSPAAQMAADGRMDPQTLRSMLRRSPGMIGQIQKVDPGFDEANIDKRYNTLKEFTNTSNTKAGGQVVALNTLVHHAELYSQAADALKNGSFKPGNAAYNAIATMFGSAPPNNAALIARFLAGETGKVATGGVPAEGEIKGILSNLGTNASPDQMKQASQKLLEIAAGRAIPLMEKVQDAKLGGVVKVIGPDAQAILAKHGFDPATMKPVAAAGPKSINTKAEYDALPSGSIYTDAQDGKQYKKR